MKKTRKKTGGKRGEVEIKIWSNVDEDLVVNYKFITKSIIHSQRKCLFFKNITKSKLLGRGKLLSYYNFKYFIDNILQGFCPCASRATK